MKEHAKVLKEIIAVHLPAGTGHLDVQIGSVVSSSVPFTPTIADAALVGEELAGEVGSEDHDQLAIVANTGIHNHEDNSVASMGKSIIEKLIQGVANSTSKGEISEQAAEKLIKVCRAKNAIINEN